MTSRPKAWQSCLALAEMVDCHGKTGKIAPFFLVMTIKIRLTRPKMRSPNEKGRLPLTDSQNGYIIHFS
jgi:hypothetical protein